ncbi:hypothetical protein [Streptomyces sp. NPDC005141]
MAGALPGARVEEAYRRTRVIWQRACPPHGHGSPVQHDSVCAVIGVSGGSVSVEVSGLSQGIVAMLAAYAEQ